jgi:parallel beta-helix repeat protein
MFRSQLFACFAATIAMAGQTVSAQNVNAQNGGGLPAEIAARLAADAKLQSDIAAEAAARRAADAQLQSNIESEAAARGSADAALDGRINAEAVARMEAIDALRRSIGGGTGGGTVNVDCAAGGSVSQALAAGATRIVVRGNCIESVTVDRDDVTLQGDVTVAGSIHGPDQNVNTITVTGHRVTLETLTVSGGRNGITGIGASNLMVRNCTVQSTGRVGIIYVNGSSGTVDNCIVQSNPSNGVGADGAQMTIVNSTISNNVRFGVAPSNGASVRIGVTDRLAPAGNTISQNAGGGISVTGGSVATIAMNQITRNGGIGISVFLATASIVGGNTISDNSGVGVSVNNSRAVLGDTGFVGFGIPSLNRITGNGNLATAGGVIAFLGSSMVIRDVEIVGNNGAGLLLSVRSQGQLFSSTIQNNASDGIRLLLGSALLPLPAATTVSGNSGFGIQCLDSESSVVNTVPSIMLISGNGAGNVAASCTSFDASPAPAPAPLPL